jgi:Protein of unknown function (DUF2470)
MRYAEHYAKVSRLSSGSAKLKDISLDRMVVTAAGKDHTIPIDPPMSSFKDARERVVAMDKTACLGLGRSTVTIKEYRGPRGFQIFAFATCATTWAIFTFKSTTQPGSLLHQYLPEFSDFCAGIRPYTWSLALIHIIEASIMTQ